jgi:hypothetical protein
VTTPTDSTKATTAIATANVFVFFIVTLSFVVPRHLCLALLDRSPKSLLAYSSSISPSASDTPRISPEWFNRVGLPALMITASGEYDLTPEHQPILGRVGDGVLVAPGFGGHRFMIAPAVARILADLVLGDSSDPALETLDAARFAENRLVTEPRLV